MRRFWIFGGSGDSSSLEKNGRKKGEIVAEQPAQPDQVKEELVSGDSAQTNSTVTKPKDSPPSYYAVSLPYIHEGGGERSPLVFLDKKEALDAVKRNDGARFKVFHSREDAVRFASQPVEQTCRTPKVELSSSPPIYEKSPTFAERNSISLGEKPSQFRGPKSQDLVKLRKVIVAGDVDDFKATVWSNPRYLISSGDTPSILQEGFRYNALHVAAKHKQPELCQQIISVIENPAFMTLLYSDDTEEVRYQRIAYILDLYLNMPDKGLCETPLHFAAKFGCQKSVQILASHPACDKTRKNKYGFLAKEIICERCSSSGIALKQQIEEAFEEQYFVPVLRSEDNSVQPTVGKPCSKKSMESPLSATPDSPCSTVLSVMAVAGPMSPRQANLFYKNLKTPPVRFSKAQYHELHNIRLNDTEKGLERIGRDLARDLKAPWKEFWPCLNAWCDLSSPEGLNILEKHLRQHYREIISKAMLSISVDLSGCNDIISSVTNESNRFTHSTPSLLSTSNGSSGSSGISRMCLGLQNFHMYDSISGNTTRSPDVSTHCMCIGSPDKDCTRLGQQLDMNHQENVCKSSEQRTECKLRNEPKMDGNRDKHSEGDNSAVNTTANIAEINSHQGESYNGLETPKRNRCKIKKKLEDDFCDNFYSKHEYSLIFPPDGKDSANCVKQLFARPDTHQFLFSMNNLVLCLLKMFSVIALNSDFSDGRKVHELAEDVLPEIKCLLKSCRNMDQDFSEVHSFIAEQVYRETCSQFLKHEENVIFRLVTSYVECYFSVTSLEEEETAYSSEILWQHLKCILRHFCMLFCDKTAKLCPCSCNWTYPVVHPEKFEIWGDCDIFFVHRNLLKSDIPTSVHNDNDDDEEEEFFTPPSSPSFSFDSEPVTPKEGLEVYVGGEFPSKADLDVLRAIESVPLEPVLYPHITQWKHLIMSKDKKAVESWPSPLAKKTRPKIRISGSLTTPPVSPLASPCDTPKKLRVFQFPKNPSRWSGRLN